MLAATNVDVDLAIREGNLREDLYYRLSAFTIRIRPLRERRDEIPTLLRHLMDLFSSQYSLHPRPLSPTMVEACVRYDWPGNIRELENLMRRYLILGDEQAILAELSSGSCELSTEPYLDSQELEGGLKSRVRSVRQSVEAEAIWEALEKTRWNRMRAANLLNISSRTLRYKMAQYGMRTEHEAPSRQLATGDVSHAHPTPSSCAKERIDAGITVTTEP